MVVKDSVDRGWAWVVLAACFARAFMVIGMNKAFGMFFVEYIEDFQSNSAMVSSIISTQQAMFSISSFLILTVGDRFFTSRPIILFGSVLMGIGFFLSAFAPNVEFLFLSQGILFGMGQAAASGPSVVLLNSYFDKKRGLANSLSNSGGSLGGLILPLIIQALLEEYALQGAQMIVSAMLLNIVVAGALMRPLRTTIPHKNITIDVDANEPKQTETKHIETTNKLNNNEVSMSADDIRMAVYKPEIISSGKHKQFLKLVPENSTQRKRTFSENLHEHRFTPTFKDTEHPHTADVSKIDNLSNIYGSLADVTSSVQSVFLAKRLDSAVEPTSTEKENESCLSTYCLGVINFRILKNHHLKFIYLVGFLAIYGCRLQISYLPPYAKDCGISRRNISYLVTIIGACDFAGRFAVAWIADSKRIQRNHIIASSLIIMGITSVCISFVTTFTTFSIYSVIYGLFGGLYNSFLPLLLVECVGAKNLSTSLAFVIQVHGISISSMAPVLGTIRDLTGSYHWSFYIMGAGMLMASVLLICVEPFVKKLELRRQEK